MARTPDHRAGRRALLRAGGLTALGAVIGACSPGGGGTGAPTSAPASSAPPSSTPPAPPTPPPWPPVDLAGRVPDANGVVLPDGFSSRVVATSGTAVGGTGYVWPANPDGAATFPAPDGGWFLVVNSEVGNGGGGVSSLRFTPDGDVVDAAALVTGTTLNCAGGPTPWGTWLSCEEVERGQVVECVPGVAGSGTPRPALGRFVHEAVTVDEAGRCLYLTEDRPDGRFYRFTPSRWPALDDGVLEAAAVAGDGSVTWLPVPDPSATDLSVRQQMRDATAFDGGEGITSGDGRVWFTTKGDSRVWELDARTQRLRELYAVDTGTQLTGVDNITFRADGGLGDAGAGGWPGGLLWVAEDGGNMELVVVDRDGRDAPFLRIPGHAGSEIAGPAFSPDGSRLYLSSQRGSDGAGVTYEIIGPFLA